MVEQQFATFLLSRIDVKLSALSTNESAEIQIYVDQLKRLLDNDVFDVDTESERPATVKQTRRRRTTSPDVTTSHNVTSQ